MWWFSDNFEKVLGQSEWKGIMAMLRTGLSVTLFAACLALSIHSIMRSSVNSGFRYPKPADQSAIMASKSNPQNLSSVLPVVAFPNSGEKLRGLQKRST